MATIVDNLLQAAEKNKDKPALILGEQSLTYAELFQHAKKIAVVLQHHGLQARDRVALVVENCPDYAAMYYGVLMAGGVVMALNTAAKVDDLHNWVSHADASFVFAKPKVFNIESANSEHYALIQCHDGNYQYVMTMGEMLDFDEQYQPLSINENELASIIYTSGTTGAPKGIMLSHNNLATNMESIRQYLPINSEDRVLNVLPFYYSYGNTVLHTNLGCGATIVLENSMMFPVKIAESMEKHKATGFYGVGSIYALLLSRANLHKHDLTSMRYMTLAGGPMAPAHIEKIMQTIPSAEFYMMYGQTEATARLAYIPADLIQDKLGSAGKAIPGVRLEIRDENGDPLPIGEEGEIYATGDNIMMGYWNNPEMTKEVIKDGWLRTGDIAKMDGDGYLYMTGRRTDMIKSGANRISPKEIEEKLAELDGIEESAAIGIPDEVMGQVIKVYIVKTEGSEITEQKIMKHCKDKLAQFKLPKQIEFIEKLPKTPSGKLQRFKLLEN